MKYRRKILIIWCLAFAFLALTAAGAQAQISVTTSEVYTVTPHWVGFDSSKVPILMVTINNNSGGDLWLKRVTVSSECDTVADVGTVSFWRESGAAAGFQPTGGSKDTELGVEATGYFNPTTHKVTFDWTNVIPPDPIYLHPANTTPSPNFYIVFAVRNSGLNPDSSGRTLDAKIATQDVVAWDRLPTPTEYTAPATPQGEGQTYQILLDDYPPDFALDNIDLLTDSCAFKLNATYACTVWDVIDNAVIAGYTSTVKADLTVLGESATRSLTYNAGPPATNYYTVFDTIPNAYIPNGMDIPKDWDISSGYVIKVTATDPMGNSRSRDVTQVYKYLDTIWPDLDSSDITMQLVYDPGLDGIASVGDSVKMTVNMLNQPPANDAEEILNTLWGANYNGVYIFDNGDFNGLDPLGQLTYPFYLYDDPVNEVWDTVFQVVPGNTDRPAYHDSSRVWVTAEDNIGHSPDCSPASGADQAGDIGNRHKVISTRAPFGIDNDTLVHGVAYYDLDTGGDATCPNEINIGDRIRIWIDLSMNTDTITSVTVDMLNSELGGTQNQVMYDDGTNGDDTAGDKIFTFEWTIPAPATGGTDNTPGTHYVVITYADDGGNWSYYRVYTLRGVDTELPDPVENLTAIAMAGGVIKLDWDDPSGTTDEYEYHIYSNGGSGTINYTADAGHRFHPDTEWESDPLTHGMLYCFGIRVEDNACNMDTNNWIMACATADAEPPTATFINPLDGQTFCKPVQVVVQSPDLDIDKFKIWFRQQDVDPGTDGDQPGPWVYGVTIQNDGEFGTGTWNPSGIIPDGPYEGVVCGIDLAGNEQDTTTAYNAGQTVSVIWDKTPPVVFISSINGEDAYSVILNNGDNTICVYAVDNLADSMLVMMEIRDDYAMKDTIEQGWVHKEDISPTNPYCFDFSLANWQTDVARLKVYVWDESQLCEKGKAEIDRPVQDIYPVVATMTKPVNYERVMGSTALPVQAEFLAGSPVDEVTLVQFQEKPHGDDTWTTFATVYSPSGNYFNSTWNNTAYEHNDQVDLRALFYDDAIPANVETTAFITVTVDKEGPSIELVIENAQLIDEIKYVAGDSLFLAARVLDYENVDIKKVHFYRKKTTEPDMYYQFIGSGNMENNYTFFRSRKYIANWDTAYYHIKALAWDASWNDSSAALDSFFYKGDDSAPQVAIKKIRTDTLEWINPSKYLRASEEGMHVFVQAGKQVTAWHVITTPWDSMLVDNVAYSWDGFNLGNYGLNDSMTFNPLEDGIISHWDLEDNNGSYWAKLEADLTDIFGNTTDDHSSYLVVLDVTGNQVVVINPDNQEYHSDQIRLRAASINDYNLRSVTYWYRPLGETEWIEIATVTDPGRSGWGYVWYTRNNVPDGWYQVMATSEDLAGNISEPGPFHRFFIGNTPPVGWMVSPSDSAFLGPNLDMRPGPGGNDFDTVIAVYAKPKNSGGCPVQDAVFKYKPITSSSWREIPFEDDLTYFADSLYGRLWNITTSGPNRVEEGWYHVAAEVCDSCGNEVWSDTISVYMDLQNPFAEIIGVNDNHFPYNMDLGGPPYEDTLKARAWDPMGERALRYTGFASGLDSLQFMIYKGSCSDYKTSDDIVFFGAVYEPNDSAQYEMIWNSEGADTGNYCFFVQAVDKVRNRMRSDGVPLRIEDHSQRVATIRAFHDGEVYASVNMKGVTGVTFQYFSLASSHWVNFGLAEPINPSTWTWGDYNYQTSTMWYTPWDPSTLAEGYYLVRCLTQGPWESDWYGERKPGLSKPFSTSPGPVVRIHVDADGNVHPAETEDIDAISFRAVLETGTKGVVKIEAQRTPYLLAVYSHGAVEVERISLTKEIGTDIHNGTFEIPWSSSEGGDVRFYASVVPDTTYIEMGGFDITVVDQYLGTNGPVEFVDGSASIDIPGGAIRVNELNLVGYPTAIPPVVANECKKYTPVGNTDGLIWKWYLFGYSADTNLDDYAKITLYYDETQVTVPESELQVARWDYGDYCWEFSHVESPVVDEANHSITFWTDHLGAFAVVQSEAMRATVEVDPNCSDYSNSMPCFVAYISSEYGDIDRYSIKMRLGPVGGSMTTIYYDDTFADGYCSPFLRDYWYYDEWECDASGWDKTSGELDVCIMEDIKALSAGDWVVMVEAYDQVGNFASAVDTFTVDVKVPKITFLNGYVGKNPEFSFTIQDAESGVDTSSIYIDMYSVAKLISEGGSWVENRRYLGTYTPPQIDIVNGVIDITTTLELVNNQAFDVVIYDGTYKGSPNTQDQMRIYDPGHGPGDCVGNQTDPVYQRFAIDDQPPTFSMMTSTSARPIKIKVMDKESGINWNTFKFYENGTVIDPDSIDQNNGIVHYTPDNIGVDVELNVEDNMNNLGYYNLTTEAEELTLTNAKNYPNPFENYTVIAFDLSRSADVVIKIYDFAGELVKTLVPGDYYGAGHVTKYWYGATDDGEDVANGIYLCHIEANDGSHTASEVIKIAVVRKD